MIQITKKIKSDINKYGWHVLKIFCGDGDPDFAYTIGLYKTFKHPEIILFGLPLDYMHVMLNQIARDISDGKRFIDGDVKVGFLGELPVSFKACADGGVERYMGFASEFYKGKKFPALQVYWPDKNKRFPWEAKASKSVARLQPVNLIENL